MTKKTFKPWMGLIFVILSKWQKARSMQKLESFKKWFVNSIFGVCRFVGLSQDEDELADEYDVAINHTILLNTYIKSRRYKRERCQGSAKPTCKAPWRKRSVNLEDAKRRTGNPSLSLATNESGWGFGDLPNNNVSVYRLHYLWWCISAPLDSLRE